MILKRTMHCALRGVALAGALAAVTAPAAAAPILFFGLDNTNSIASGPGPNATAAHNQFVNAVGAASISLQNFDSFVPGPLGATTTGVFADGVGVTLENTATDYLRITAGIGAFDTFATSQPNFLEALSNQNSTYFTAKFDRPVRAIGFYVTDASDWAGDARPVETLKVVLTTESSSFELDLTPGLDPHDLVNANVAFFGVLDNADPFTSIAIRSGNNPDEDALGFDDVLVSVAPAPGTLPLLLGLLPILGLLRWRSARP